MKLHSYWHSTTSYRVRAALNLKRVAYDTVPIDLVAGDQRAVTYTALNRSASVPTLVLGDAPDLADLCIVSQMYNADRLQLPLDSFPKLTKIAANCLAVPAIMAAHPDNQPDAKEIT